MRKIIFVLLLLSPFVSVCQWNNSENNHTSGNLTINGYLWVHGGATISSDFMDTNHNNSWNYNLAVRNNSDLINSFSRLSFVSQSAGLGAISVQKMGTYNGDMLFQVRNGPQYYITPLTIKSDGNVGVGGSPHKKLDVGNFQDGSLSNQTVLRLRNTVAQNLAAGWGSAIEFYNMSNNLQNVGFNEGGAKIISEASDYGWSHNLKFRVVRNENYQTQTGIDALTITQFGNVGIGNSAPGATLHVGRQEVVPGTTGESVRLALQPFGHTGGLWNFKTRDASQNAFLLLATERCRDQYTE